MSQWISSFAKFCLELGNKYIKKEPALLSIIVKKLMLALLVWKTEAYIFKDSPYWNNKKLQYMYTENAS